MATTLKFVLDVDDRGGSAAFGRLAGSADGATHAVERNSRALQLQSKTAEVSARATLSMARSGKILDDALRELDIAEGRVTRQQAELAAMTDEARRQLEKEGRAAEVAAIKLRLSGKEAKGAGDGALFAGKGFGALGPGLTSVIGGAVALAPIAVTLGAGLGGLGLAALQTAKRTDEMRVIFGPLKKEVRDFQNSLQPQVLTLFGDGAGIARDALHQLQPVAAATGTGLHKVLGDVGAEFRSGEWQKFFQFMAQQAGPDLQLVGSLLVDVAKDVPGLLEQLQPAGRLVLILADDLFKAVGALEKMHLVLPLLGAAIGFAVAGPLGALAGGLAGVAIQAAAANTEVTKTGQAIRNLDQLKPVTKDMVGFASVAGIVAANMSGSATAVADVKNAIIDAHPVVGTLRGDMDLLNSSVASGNSQLAAYSDLWDKFVGKSVSYQQAVLNLRQAFEGYDSAVKSSGRTSTAAQQAFLSVFTTMESGLQALHQQGASVGQVNSFYADSIRKLNALHGLTPQQRADVQGLTKDYIAWASVTQGLPPKILATAGALRDTFLAQLANGHRIVPQVKADIDALANSVLKTGQRSAATASDRATLIADLRRAGLTAQAAASLVADFQRQVSALHGKTVNVDLTTSGHGQIIITGTGINQRTINTSTGVLRGPGGHAANGLYITSGRPGVDDQLIAAQLGELIVPTAMVRAGEVDHLRGRIPGFAAGGVVGKVSGAESGIASADATWAAVAATAFAQSAVQASMKAAAAAAPGFSPGAPATGSAAAAQAFARSVLPAGWSWPALLSLWNRESGWNAWAVNPSSGAYGIPQSLGHGHPYNLGDYANQVRWGIGYIAGRYGNSQNAWAHEQAFNWYDHGGVLRPGVTLAVNGTGRDEYVSRTPPGGSTYNITVNVPVGAHPAQAGKAVVEAIREYELVNGKGWRAP